MHTVACALNIYVVFWLITAYMHIFRSFLLYLEKNDYIKTWRNRSHSPELSFHFLFSYLNRRCGMIVHEPAIHQMTVELKLLQVPLGPSVMNQVNTEAVKRPPEYKKCETIHKTRQST